MWDSKRDYDVDEVLSIEHRISVINRRIDELEEEYDSMPIPTQIQIDLANLYQVLEEMEEELKCIRQK